MIKKNSKHPLVSIVIPSYNSKSMIRGCLKSVLATDYPNFEVIIVDDKSKDDSLDILRDLAKLDPRIKVQTNDVNMGPAGTRNHGIRKSEGEYVAFIETDMKVDPNWLNPLIKVIESDPSLGAVQSKVLDINHRKYIQSTGVYYDPHTFWVESFACGFPKDSFNKSQEIGIGAVGSLVRKKVLNKIGYFDSKIVHNIDDTELGWRIWLSGSRSISVPESITFHWTAKPAAMRDKVTPTLKSEIHFHKTPRIFIKNYELINLFHFLPWLYFAYFLRILKNIKNGNFNPLYGFIISTAWQISSFSDALKERSRIQKFRKRSDQEMFNILGIKGNFFSVYLGRLQPNLNRVKEVFD